jgi:hypothetical protein
MRVSFAALMGQTSRICGSPDDIIYLCESQTSRHHFRHVDATHEMDPAKSALDLAALADEAAASLYQLCAKWSDAPRGVHELMDDMERVGAFLYAEPLDVYIAYDSLADLDALAI